MKSTPAVGTPRLLRPMLLGILLTPLGIGVDGLTLALPGVAMVLRAPLGKDVDIAA